MQLGFIDSLCLQPLSSQCSRHDLYYGCAVGKKMTSVWFAMYCGFRFGFDVTKLTAVSGLSVRFLHCVLFSVPLRYDTSINYILSC